MRFLMQFGRIRGNGENEAKTATEEDKQRNWKMCPPMFKTVKEVTSVSEALVQLHRESTPFTIFLNQN